MNEVDSIIAKKFGNKTRIRVCGICQNQDKVLLVAHAGLGSELTWLPPGGGVEFSTSTMANLIREFKEETGLEVEVKKFLFVCEYLSKSLHSIELFYEVVYKSGTLSVGFDPEMKGSSEIIKKTQFMSFEEINLLDKKSVHGVFLHCKSIEELLNLNGYFLFENKSI